RTLLGECVEGPFRGLVESPIQRFLPLGEELSASVLVVGCIGSEADAGAENRDQNCLEVSIFHGAGSVHSRVRSYVTRRTVAVERTLGVKSACTRGSLTHVRTEWSAVE